MKINKTIKMMMMGLMLLPVVAHADVFDIADALCNKLISCQVPTSHGDCVEAIMDTPELADNFTRARNVGNASLSDAQDLIDNGVVGIRPNAFNACLAFIDNLSCHGPGLSVDDARPSAGDPLLSNIENLIEGPCERVFVRR